jgi:two-component system response regulator AtoC
MKKILVVDDEPAILFMFKHLFRKSDADVITCEGVERAKEEIDKYNFTLVISDIRLTCIESREGLEIFDYVRKLSPETAVILMTAFGSEHEKEEAYQKGVFHYYEKPLDVHHLITKVRSLGITIQ